MPTSSAAMEIMYRGRSSISEPSATTAQPTATQARSRPRWQVAAATALQLRDAATLDAQQLAIRRARRHLQRHRTVGRRQLDGCAQSGFAQRHRHLDDEVGRAAALVQLRRRDARDDEEVAALAAAVAGLALALQADASAVLDAGRDLDRVALRAALAAGAAATLARILDHGPVAAAARARLRQREEALALGDDASALALGAENGRRARLRTRAAALAARGLE